MRSYLIFASLLAGLAHAAPAPSVQRVLVQGVLAQTTTDDDDEDVAPSTPTAKPAPSAPAPAEKAPAKAVAAEPAKPSDAPTAQAAEKPEHDQFELVSGAPLYNPNVAVHIVEKKTYSDAGRFEFVLFPVTMQVNGKFTQHFGTMGSLVYHLQENFALQVTGGYNWFNAEAPFNAELADKSRTEAPAATSLLLLGGVTGGVEVAPIYGKFTLFEGTLAHFSLVLNGGAGMGWTRHQLKPESVRQDGSVSPATYGDTGSRFMAGLGAGFRLRLGNHFALRIEVRDVVYAARTDRVNGCNVDDLRALDAINKAGGNVLQANVSEPCRADGANLDNPRFAGTDDNGNRRTVDIPLALNLVKNPTSDVLNNVSLYLGASFVF